MSENERKGKSPEIARPRRDAVSARKPVDARPRLEEDPRRFVLDHLLYFFRVPYVMLSAYLDESGTHDASLPMCVAGILYDRAAVRRLDRAWKKELEQAGIRRFHTVEQAHLQGEFKGKDRGFADSLYIRLLGLISKYSCGSMTVCAIPRGEFDLFRKQGWEHSPYTICPYVCMQSLAVLAQSRMEDDQVAFFIESGHSDMGELNALLRQQRHHGRQGLWSCQFVDKADLRPVQTADVLAYETRNASATCSRRRNGRQTEDCENP